MLCRNPRAPEIYYTALYGFPNQRESRADYTSLPRPTHNVAILLSGRGIMTEGERTVKVREGDSLFIPRHARYRSCWLGDPKKSIESLPAEYGFASPVYFRCLFKNITGVTPSEYRSRQMLI